MELLIFLKKQIIWMKLNFKQFAFLKILTIPLVTMWQNIQGRKNKVNLDVGVRNRTTNGAIKVMSC